MKRKVNQIPDELKYRIIQEYLTTEITRKELGQKYGFRGNSCISNWMRMFDVKGPTQADIDLITNMNKEKPKTPREQELELKVKKLESELEKEKLRTLALTTIIDIAERELHIPIRKKSGAKR